MSAAMMSMAKVPFLWRNASEKNQPVSHSRSAIGEQHCGPEVALIFAAVQTVDYENWLKTRNICEFIVASR